jgi:phosphoribosylanthranilate isomerase
MSLIKICGITNFRDASICVEAGVEMLGFNFYPPSPRYIKPEAAQKIIEQLPQSILTVGVFVDEPPEHVTAIANEAGVRALQLHGSESPDYCQGLSDWFMIKALKVGSSFEPKLATSYPVAAIMLDTFDQELHGGTGRRFDWSLARATRDVVSKLILAGGLSPDNVAEAIQKVSPFAVDVCSRVEESPGKKDPQLLRALINAVREASKLD